VSISVVNQPDANGKYGKVSKATA